MISLATSLNASSAAYSFGQVRSNLMNSVNRLSSGSRLNDSGEDAAGTAVSLMLKNRITGTSVTRSYLENLSSFLEVQHSALVGLAETYKKIDELNTKKKDPLISPEELNLYNNQITSFVDKILEIKEETFNGTRLFSDDHTLKTQNTDVSILNGSTKDVSQFPLLTRNERVRRLELIFAVDTTGSMGGTINGLRTSITGFVNEMEQRVDNWVGKIVDFKDLTVGEATTVNPFVDDAGLLLNQINNMGASGGGDLPESLIDGIAQGFDSTGWTNDPDSVRGIIAFTDAASQPPINGTLSEIAARISAAGVQIQIYGVPGDPQTAAFAAATGAQLDVFANASNISSALSGFLDDLVQVTTGLVDFDTIAAYLAENISKQSAVRNLIDSSELNYMAASSARAQIVDLDVAAESIRLSRMNILNQAGAMVINQTNISASSVLNLLR